MHFGRHPPLNSLSALLTAFCAWLAGSHAGSAGLLSLKAAIHLYGSAAAAPAQLATLTQAVLSEFQSKPSAHRLHSCPLMQEAQPAGHCSRQGQVEPGSCTPPFHHMHCPCTGAGSSSRQVSSCIRSPVAHTIFVHTPSPGVQQVLDRGGIPPACPACLLALLCRLRKIVRVKAEAAGGQVFVAAAAVWRLALLALGAVHQAQPGLAPQAAAARLAVRAALKALQRWGCGCEAVE